MSAVFLSASIPSEGRAGFETGDPFLIREAVAAFVEVTLGRRPIVWGGHPAITPMIWAAAEALGLDYGANVHLFQSQFFADRYPEDNHKYGNVTYIPAVEGDLQASLASMRTEMLHSQEFGAAVFVGGMEGIIEEHRLFRQVWPAATVVAVPSAGGVARKIFYQEAMPSELEHALDFSAWLYELLSISPSEPRARHSD